MNIIETLYTVLKTDSTESDKALDRNRKKTDDLAKDMKKLDEQNKKTAASFSTVAGKVIGMFLATGAVVKSFSAASDLAARTAGIGDVADNLGIAVEKVDALGKAIERAGGDAQGSFGSIATLTERMGKAFRDTEGPIAKTFTSLGIGLKNANGEAKDSIDILLELSEALEGVNRAQALQTLTQLGVTDPKTVENILKGRRELEALLEAEKARGVVTQQQVERARKLTDAQDRLRANTGRLADGFFDRLIPALTWAAEKLEGLTEWASDHQTVITGFFLGIAGVVAYAYLPAMVAAAGATLAATWPILLLVAAVAGVAAAFALAYDDISAFLEGGDSMLGEFVKEFPGIVEWISKVGEAFKLWGDVIVWPFKTVMEYWEQLKSPLRWLNSKVSGALFPAATPEVKDSVSTAREVMGAAASAGVNSTSSTAISNRTSNRETRVQIGQVTVETQATDSRGVARDLKNDLAKQLYDLQAENSFGVVS